MTARPAAGCVERDPSSEISEPDIRAALDAYTLDSLRPISVTLALYYLVMALSHLLVLPPDIAPIMAAVAGFSVALALGLRFILSRWAIPARRAHAIMGGMVMLTLFNTLLHLYLVAEVRQTTNVMLVITAAGLLLLSDRWLIISIVAALGGWGLIVASLPPSEEWSHFAFAMFSSVMLSVIVHIVRVRTFRRLEYLRLQDVRQKQELEHRAVQMETSIGVGQRIITLLDLDTLLNQVAELIKERYGFYFVGIFLLDESRTQLVARAGTGEVGQTLREQGHRQPVGQGVIGAAAQQQQAVCVADVRADPRFVPNLAIPETRSELALPLLLGETLLGVLDISSDAIAAFREEDVPVLQLLADQVTIAIQNAFLYEGEKARRLLAETLYEVGRALSRTLDLEEVLDLILRQLTTLVPYDRAAVMLQNEETLEFVATRGFPAEIAIHHLRVSIKDQDVFQDIYETQRPLAIADVKARPDWQYVDGLTQTRAWLGVPLIRSGEVIGMLSLARLEPLAYSDEEINLTTAFAGQAALALENARLYDNITRFNQQLEGMVAERTEALQEAYSKLERLDRTKSDFIGVVSHELRTPLTVLQGYSQILLRDGDIKDNEYHLQMVSGIHSGAVRLHEIVNAMLDMVKIDSRSLQLSPEPLHLARVFARLRDRLADPLRERQLTLELALPDSLPPVTADREALEKLFDQLLINAIKYTPDGGRLTVTGQPHAEGVEVVVSDTGIGIDPAMQELIFTKFYQTGKVELHSSSKTKFKGGGPGLGLAIARGIVEAHGGRLWVESPGCDEETCPGSAFHVVLPLHPAIKEEG